MFYYNVPDLQAATSIQAAKAFYQELVSIAAMSSVDERRDRVQSLVGVHFEFESFYEKSPQDHWPEWSVDQRGKFDQIFRTRFIDHLARHLGKLDRLMADHPTYQYEKESPERVIVTAKSKVEGEPVSVRLYLVRKNRELRVYDLDIAGANLSRNYRGRFNYLIRKNGYEGLLAQLKSEAAPGPEKEGT